MSLRNSCAIVGVGESDLVHNEGGVRSSHAR
jgi:hypothetical protein